MGSSIERSLNHPLLAPRYADDGTGTFGGYGIDELYE